MGNGYLGKISAIVTANTGDFKPKLDAAASDVQKFARTVQSNLTTASTQAGRALDQIWTPLQKLERSLQAAGSMKLSFKGFEGAIKGVDELKTRLASLGKRQIEINVSGTGFKTVQQIRDAVSAITSKDVKFVANLGGLSQARGLRGAMSTGEQATLDKFSGLQSLSQLQRIVDVVGGRGFQQASTQMRQLVSVSEQLAKPIGAAASQFTKLGADVQASFGPALLKAQKGVDNLFADIKLGATISEERFEGVRRKVEQVTAAVGRMAEAQAIVSGGKTGQELAFRAPRVYDELTSSNDLMGRASRAPAATRDRASFADSISALSQLQTKIAQYHASVERQKSLGLDTSEASQRLDEVLVKSQKLRSVIEADMDPGGAQRKAEADDTASLIRREQAAKEAEAKRFAQQQKVEDNEIAALIRREQGAKEAEAKRLAQQQKVEDNEIAALIRREQGAKEAEAKRLAQQQKVEDNEIAALIRREQAAKEAEAKRLAQQQKVEDNEIAALIRREQGAKEAEAKRLAQQQKVEDNEIAALIRREQGAKEAEAKRLAQQQKVEDNEIAALIRREQGAKEAEARRFAQQQQAEESEIAALIRREQGAKEAEARRFAQQQRVEENEIASLIRREQGAKEAEARRFAQQQRVEDNETAALIRREQGAKEAEARRFAQQQRVEDNEIAALIRREQGAKEAEAQRFAQQQRAEDNEIAALIRREQAGKEAEARRQQGEGEFTPIFGGLAGPAPRDYFGDQLERRARSMAGGDITADTEQARAVDRVGQSIAATRAQLDSLPEGVRAQFIPAIQRATDQFATLSRLGPAATREQIAAATREVERLANATARTQRAFSFGSRFGGPGRSGVEFGLQGIQLEGYSAQLQLIQRMLATVSTTARTGAVQSFNTLRAAITEAAARGTLGLRGTRDQLNALTRAAAEDISRATGMSQRAVMRQLDRAGDVGRAGFGNFGLAVQQAVFAIDDFNSVTGGLDQRIRAAGNNISQLGFILGGTAGLIAGVAASIVSQLVVGYIRWQNAGVGTEDQVRALNDALARQKSLVDGLAEAFGSLADEVARLGFSKKGAEADAFKQQIDDIRKKQREFASEQSAAVDPAVQRERGIIASRQRALENTSDPGERVRLNREIREARARERERLRQLEQQPGVAPSDAARRVADIRNRSEAAERARREALGGFRFDIREREAFAEEDRQRAADAERRAAELTGMPATAARSEVVASIEAEQDRLNELIQDSAFGGNDERRARVQELEQLKNEVLRGAVAAANALEVEVATRARMAGERIGRAQDTIAGAIEAGVPGAEALRNVLDPLSAALRTALQDMADAQERAREGGGTGEDTAAVERAKAEVDRITAAIEARRDEVSAIDAARASIERFNEAFDRVTQQAESTAQSAQSRLDEARANDLERGTQRTRDEWWAMAGDPQRSDALRAKVDEEVAAARERARRDDRVVANERRIAEIDSLFEAGEGNEELARERERLRGMNRGTVNAAVENDPAVRQARDGLIREDRWQQQRQRGRAAVISPAERAGIELGNTLQDIGQAFGGLGAADQARRRDEFNAANRRIIDDAMRQTAPAIFSMADAVQNAFMQGPSRAALQANDITTTQGAAELNRLLRGDDSARDQNLVELQKQSHALDELVAIARENGAPPGIFD